MFLRAGDERGLGWALTVLGLTLLENNRWAEGEAHYRAALEISLAGGGAAMNVTARLGLAFAAAVAGDIEAHRQQLVGVVGQISAAAGLIEDPEWLWVGHLRQQIGVLQAAHLMAEGRHLPQPNLITETLATSITRPSRSH